MKGMKLWGFEIYGWQAVMALVFGIVLAFARFQFGFLAIILAYFVYAFMFKRKIADRQYFISSLVTLLIYSIIMSILSIAVINSMIPKPM